MSFDLYATYEPVRRPPNVYRLLWEKRKDGCWYADAWNDKMFHQMWAGYWQLLSEIGFSYVWNPKKIRWDPRAATKSRVDEVMAIVNAANTSYLAERIRIDEGHRQRDAKRSAAAEKKAAMKRTVEEKKAQLAASIADRRAP